MKGDPCSGESGSPRGGSVSKWAAWECLEGKVEDLLRAFALVEAFMQGRWDLEDSVASGCLNASGLMGRG